jgi:hypothetical protein
MRLDGLQEIDGPRRDEEVEAWLRVLRKLLRVSGEQASSICEELESHLRERIRDLQVSGRSESEAIRVAIGELGDAAVLAGRFQAVARWRFRRLSMNIAIAVVAGSAALLSLVAVSRTSPAPGSAPVTQRSQGVQTASERIATEELGQLADQLARERWASNAPQEGGVGGFIAELLRSPEEPAKFTDPSGNKVEVEHLVKTIQAADTPLGELLNTVASELDLQLHARWPRLEQYGINREAPIHLLGRDLELADIFQRINESLGDMARLDFRAGGGVLEVADREFFDRRELTLVSYDVGPLIAAGEDRFGQDREGVVSELLTTLQQFVSPNDWVHNGGDLASHSLLGDRLFIEAPPRMHRQIEWILRQVPSTAMRTTDANQSKSSVEIRLSPEVNPAKDSIEIRLYPIKHIAAEEAAAALRELKIPPEDGVSALVVDSRTNAILGKCSTSAHRAIMGALVDIDLPAR